MITVNDKAKNSICLLLACILLVATAGMLSSCTRKELDHNGGTEEVSSQENTYPSETEQKESDTVSDSIHSSEESLEVTSSEPTEEPSEETAGESESEATSTQETDETSAWETNETTEAVSEAYELEYKLDEKTDAYAVAGIGTYLDEDIIIPAEHDGKPVAAILDGAFEHAKITSISFGPHILSIGSRVFGEQEHLTIYFSGTKAEWVYLPKADDWYGGLDDYTVYLETAIDYDWSIPID